MLEAVLTFIGSTAVVVFAGVFLTRFADGIAEATGLGRLLVGSIFLAGATSLPELMVDVSAAQLGKANLAVGGIVMIAVDVSTRKKARASGAKARIEARGLGVAF